MGKAMVREALSNLLMSWDSSRQRQDVSRTATPTQLNGQSLLRRMLGLARGILELSEGHPRLLHILPQGKSGPNRNKAQVV